MRRLYASFVVVLCCTALVSVSGAQALDSEALDTNEPSVTLPTSQPTPAPKVTLKARPISCATLREGQPCFVKFSMSWESDQPITVCLISEQNDAGTCWSDAVTGRFRKDLYLSETTLWNLQTLQGQSLGQVKVSVAWVYKSRRVRRNWSLF